MFTNIARVTHTQSRLLSTTTACLGYFLFHLSYKKERDKVFLVLLRYFYFLFFIKLIMIQKSHLYCLCHLRLVICCYRLVSVFLEACKRAGERICFTFSTSQDLISKVQPNLEQHFLGYYFLNGAPSYPKWDGGEIEYIFSFSKIWQYQMLRGDKLLYRKKNNLMKFNFSYNNYTSFNKI